MKIHEEVQRSEPLTLAEALTFFRRHFVKIGAITLTGAAIGVGVAYVIPKQWEATALLQVGQVQSGSSPYNPVNQVTPLEVPARTVERTKIASFTDGLLTQLGLPLDQGESPRADTIRSSFSAKVVRTADLVELKVRDLSPGDAQQSLKAAEKQILDAHTKLFLPSLNRLNADLETITANLVVAQQRLAGARKMTGDQTSSGGGARFSENVLLNDIINDMDKEVRSLVLRKSELTEQLDTSRTFNTREVGAVSVSRRPVFPKRAAFLLAGAFAGFAIGLCLSMFIEWQNNRRQS